MTSKGSESSEGGGRRKRKAEDLDMKLRGEFRYFADCASQYNLSN